MDDVIIHEVEQLREISGAARRHASDASEANRRLQQVVIRFGNEIQNEIRARRSAFEACDPDRQNCSPLYDRWQRAVRAFDQFSGASQALLVSINRRSGSITADSEIAAEYFDKLRYHMAGTPDAQGSGVAGALGGAALAGADGGGGGGGGGGSSPRTLPHGHERVSLDMVDVPDDLFETRPSKASSKDDMMWAGSAWTTEVAPGFDKGMTREDFETRDAASGATGLRRLAGVWDLYLGSDPPHGGVSGGRVDLGGGMHRTLAAKKAGAEWIPMRITH